MTKTVVITGASGFIGGAIAERLLDRWTVRSLTSHPRRNRFGGRVTSYPYDFERPERMREAFAGAEAFINTYYVRFEYRDVTFEQAVENTKTLVEVARRAGVRRIVHVSISHAREDSPLPYYRNKGRIERIIRECGLAYVILRPALVFGPGDILLNNIAYFLRRLPVFGLFGRGDYRVQPIALSAFADLAVQGLEGSEDAAVWGVAGPADYTFREVVEVIRDCVGSRARLVRTPAWLALGFLKVADLILRDVVLTRQEIEGLMREYLWVADPLRAGESLASWLNRDEVRVSLGRRYASELQRHFQ